MVWLDELQESAATGQLDLANMVVHQDFTPTEITLVQTRCAANPGRELAVSVHRSANAAQQVRTRRLESKRWEGLGIHTRVIQLPESQLNSRPGWTAIVAVKN